MKYILNFILVFFLLSCKENDTKTTEETPTQGTATVLAEESIASIIEDQQLVFESKYKKAKIIVVAKPDGEMINDFIQDKARILVLPRPLDKKELAIYRNKGIKGAIDTIAYDGIALITNKNNSIANFTTDKIKEVFQGKTSTQELVFENANSSIMNQFLKEAKVSNIPENGIVALKNSKEVLAYVAKNKNAVGFVGVNWIFNQDMQTIDLLKNVKILPVQNKQNKFVSPTQSTISTKEYPLVREIYFYNFQGTTGLGIGFASFICNDVGQRIILKSGLVPKRVPAREINIVKEKLNIKK
jgi:phosphate transport system substrate-binding protein